MTPMVALVPKAVPVRTETAQFKRNVMSRKIEGRIRAEALRTIREIVPAARQKAVSTPISTNVRSIFRMV